jgi:NADH dehydrogenase FAD-containing subunit
MSQSKFRAETLNNIDVLVVGAGFFGATIAERISNVLNKKVVVIITSMDHIYSIHRLKKSGIMFLVSQNSMIISIMCMPSTMIIFFHYQLIY